MYGLHIFTANEKYSKFSYDLSRAVNITQSDSKVFHSLAETLLWHDAETFTTAYTAPHPLLFCNNWTSPIYFFNLALTILASIGTIYLLYRVKLMLPPLLRCMYYLITLEISSLYGQPTRHSLHHVVLNCAYHVCYRYDVI